MINYIFSPQLQLPNAKLLFLQQETRPYVCGFPLGCCDHITLCVTVITEAELWKETLRTMLRVAGP